MALFRSDLSIDEQFGKAVLLTFCKKTGSFEKGFKTLNKLYKNGNVEATLALAMMNQNRQEKQMMYDLAAESGNAEAIWQSCAFIPHSYIPDCTNSMDALWEAKCLMAAERGSLDAMIEMGNIYSRRNNYAESMYWYSMGNALGHKDGKKSQLGLAHRWLAAGAPRSFTSGSPQFDMIRFICSNCYLEWNAGLKMSISLQDIFPCAINGVPIAIYLVGDICEANGNDEMAYNAYKAGAISNDAHSLRCYADMLLMGKGTKKDLEAARENYLLSAMGGDREAMYITGEFLKDTNKYKAAYWYGVSHLLGYELARERLLQIANQ